MPVAVLPAAPGGPHPHDTGNHQAKLDYWSAMIPLQAQCIMAYNSIQKQQQLADAYSTRRHPSVETANLAQRATAQVLVHKEELKVALHALAAVTPESVISIHIPSPDTSSVHDRVASLEAQVTQVVERAEHHNRWLGLVEESTTRIEKANKSIEDEQTRLVKSNRHLEGRVSQLSSPARVPGNPSQLDPRVPFSAHLATEKRIDSVDARTKDFATKATNLDQRLKAVEDAQRKAPDVNARIQTLAGELKVVQREAHDTRAKVDPLLPLSTKTDSLLSSIAANRRLNQELEDVKRGNSTMKAQIDVVADMCKSTAKKVEDLRNDEIAPLLALKADVTGLLPLKDHIPALEKFSDALDTLDTIKSTLTGLAPLNDYVGVLKRLAAQSVSLISLISQQEQTARTLQQLESDVSSCMNNVYESQTSSKALETRVKVVEEWRPVVDQQKEVAEEQTRLKTILDQTTRINADARNRNARDLETVKAGLRKLEAEHESNKDAVASVGSLCSQVGQANATSRSIRTEIAEINNQIAQLKVGALGTTEKANSGMEQIKQEMKNMQDQINPLGAHVPALVALSGRSTLLVKLPERLTQLSTETQESVRQNLVDCKAESAVIFKQYSQSHEKLRKSVDELQEKSRVETKRIEQVEAQALQIQKETKSALESVEQTRLSSKASIYKSLEELQTRVAAEKQRTQQLETRISELQQDSTTALQARTKLQASMKALKTSVDVIETRVDPYEPLKNHVDALASIADKHVQINLLARNLKQAQASSGHVENVFLACHATQVKMESLRTSVERLNQQTDPTSTVEALAAELSSLRPLADRIAKVEEQTTASSGQHVLLQETIDKFQEKVSKWESDHKVLHGKITSSTKSLRTEIFEVKTKAEDALRVANETAQSVDQLLPLKSQLAILKDLPSQSEQLLALSKQSEATKAEMVKLSSAHEKGVRRCGELDESMALLKKEIEGVERKANGAEIDVVKLGQDLKGEKETLAIKIRAMEAEISRLSSHEHSNAVIGLATPSGSPMSPTHRTPSTPDSRVTALERFAESAKRELKNIAQNLTRIDHKQISFKEQLAGTNGRITELSVPVQADAGALSPLADCVPALVALAAQEAALSRTPEHVKTLAGIIRRVNGLDSDFKDLNSRVPAVEQFELMTELLTDIPSLKELIPLREYIKPILWLAGYVDILSPLAEQAKSLIPLVQSIGPLASRVEKLSPLDFRVAELQVSVTRLQNDVAGANARPRASTSSRPRPPPAEEPQLPPISFLPQPSSPLLRSSPEIESSPRRSSKKRKLEDAIESLEERYDSIRNEVDSVAWDVMEMANQISTPKRARTRSLPSSQEFGEITELDSPQVQEYDSAALDVWRKKVDRDLDRVQKVLLQLWQGEGEWLERLGAALERVPTKVLMPREGQDGSTNPAIARRLDTLVSDIEVLRLAVEAQGSNTVVFGASSLDAMMERNTDRVLRRMAEHHAKFKTELEETISKEVKPIKKLCRALSTADVDRD